jgi:hypothetical protein
MVEAQERWKTVDEGFFITMPRDWKKQKVQPIDSNCGTYKTRNADLEFDEVFGLGYTTKKANTAVEALRKKEADPKLLKPGEEVWHLDGRIADFSNGRVDSAIYGQRRFTNVAGLHIPYENEPGYLHIFILYRGEEDLSVVRRVLQSIKWKKHTDAPLPNPQGGANGRQPSGLETNRTSAAAASRRSP